MKSLLFRNIIIGIFLFMFVMVFLPVETNKKLLAIVGAFSSLAIVFTIYQAYEQYTYQSEVDMNKFNIDYWDKVLDKTSDELYSHWYNGDFNGLPLKRHQEWSRIGANIEAINSMNGYNLNGFDFTDNEGWRIILWDWINDEEFKRYWETDKKEYDEKTQEIVHYFWSITEEENNKLNEEERKRYAEKINFKYPSYVHTQNFAKNNQNIKLKELTELNHNRYLQSKLEK